MPATAKRRLRQSQAVTTFGPGSIVDLRQESVMMMGIDYWPENRAITIHEPNLERLLVVESFRMPSTAEGVPGEESKDLPVVRFPRWLVCPGCNRLGEVKLFTSTEGAERLIRCPDCKKQVYPARLVVACARGHISDFPWSWWVHRGRDTECTRPSLFLVARGQTASLGDLLLTCKECGASTTLAGATQQDNLKGLKCQGNRPWLMDNEPCDEPLIPLQRGASNVYFSVVASSMSIPPWSSNIHTALNRHWVTLKAVPNTALAATIEGLGLPARLQTTTEKIVQAIIDRKSGSSAGEKQLSEAELRYREAEALRTESLSTDDTGDFCTREATVHPDLEPWIARVMLVERLREVRALRGFSRVNAPDPSGKKDSLAPLAATYRNWLPAIEVRGEGIYVELAEGELHQWQEQNSISLERTSLLQEKYEEMCARRNWEAVRRITPRLVLTHTLAHALIRQLSLESGYSSAAIRERLYVFEGGELDGEAKPLAGFLLYTSSADSEGSLGGLMRQGLPDRLLRTVVSAINESAWCSSDPLCVESMGQGHDAMNLAACHACMLLSETCCEEFNRLLDRGMLTGLPDRPAAGFFSELVGG